MMLWSLSSVPEKMTQELNPNRLSSKDKGDFPPELKLYRIDSPSRAQAPQTRISLKSSSSMLKLGSKAQASLTKTSYSSWWEELGKLNLKYWHERPSQKPDSNPNLGYRRTIVNHKLPPMCIWIVNHRLAAKLKVKWLPFSLLISPFTSRPGPVRGLPGPGTFELDWKAV